MGNTDSKLSSLYREHVLQLGGETVVLRDDNGEFSQFYRDFIVGGNCTMEMFNHLVSPRELRSICKSNSRNVSNLLEFISLTIIQVVDSMEKEREVEPIPLMSTSIPALEIKLADLLVCVRILTKIYPMQLSSTGEESWFWDRNEEGTIPGFLLLKALLKLLFVQGFTVPCLGAPGQITHVLWENGIYTQDTSYELQAARIDSNRLEIINLLLALCSADLYGLPNNFLVSLGHLAPEYDVICLVASIVNTVCRYCTHGEESSMPYRNFSYKQSQQQQLPQLRFSLVSSCLQLLNLMCLHSNIKDAKPLAELIYPGRDPAINSNIALSYLSTLSREFDLRLLLTSFAKIFKLPVNLAVEQESSLLSFPRKHRSTSSVGSIDGRSSAGSNSNGNSNHAGATNSNVSSPKAPGSASKRSRGTDYGNHTNNGASPSSSQGNSSLSSSSLPPISPLFLQSIIFLTVLVQNNRIFQNYVADKFGTKLIVFIIYYLRYYDDNSCNDNCWELTSTIIPLCYNLALYFSSKKLVLSKMLETFSPNYYTNKLPNFFKLSSGNINHLTYRDFAMIHLCNMAISDVRENLQPRSWLFELIYNLLPIRANLRDEELVQLSSKKRPKSIGNGGLSYNASMSLLHLLSKMSNKNYLTTYAYSPSGASKDFYACSPGYKLDCLALLLRVISIYVILYFEESKNLTFALCRHQRILFQIKDSIDTISKNLNAPASDLKIDDYFENVVNLNSAKRATKPHFGDHCEESNTNNMYANQTLMFNSKRMSTVSENDRDNDNESNYDLSLGNIDDNASNGTSRSVSGSNLGKNIELWEYADLSTNLIISDRKVYDGIRPKWPVGITAKSKAKKPARSDLSSSWAGSDTLPLLIRCVRILLKQFPTISTISTKEYYQLLGEIVQFKNTFESSIKQYLPIFVSGISEAQPLKVDLTAKNVIYQKWVCMICWSEIFNTHSAAYPVLPVSTANSNYNGSRSSEPNAYTGNGNGSSISRVSSADTLEGSVLSGTNSNSSSLMGYLSTYKSNEVSINSPLEIGTYMSPNSKPEINDATNNNSNAATSFLRFAWNGLTKKDNGYAPIQEDTGAPGSPMGSASSRQNSFVLDTGLLKPNIWTGTRIRLFEIKTREREEFSFLDMTSSLLKRLRFNSITSTSSTDTLNSAGGNPNLYSNGNAKSNDLNSRPYTPKESVLMVSNIKK